MICCAIVGSIYVADSSRGGAIATVGGTADADAAAWGGAGAADTSASFRLLVILLLLDGLFMFVLELLLMMGLLGKLLSLPMFVLETESGSIFPSSLFGLFG